MTYSEDVGTRLRAIRSQQGMSLQDVERASEGEWKAAVVGSYERGDRNISASRLCELADFYGVPPAEILPSDDSAAPIERTRGLVIDLKQLSESTNEYAGLRRYCESIQLQRGDFNRDQLSVRGDDLRALSVILDQSVERLLALLQREGIIRGALEDA